MPNDKTYCELPASELRNVDFSLVVEDSEETLRWNEGRTTFIVKWVGSTPRFIPRGITERTAPNMREEMRSQGDWGDDSITRR